MILKENFCWLYGVYLGDGFITYNNNPKINNLIGLKAIDLDFVEKFKRSIEYVTCKNTRAIIRKYHSPNSKLKFIYSYRTSCPELNYLIEHLTFKEILLFDRKYKNEILQGLYDSEGSVSKDGYIISFVNTDYKIINLVRDLLSELEISFNFRESTGKGSFSSNPKNIFEIRIINKRNIKIFKKNVGFSITRKKEKLDKINLVPDYSKRWMKNEH